MNVLRDYNPRLFEILGIPNQRASKAHLSKYLFRYIRNQGYEICNNSNTPESETYIDFTPESMRELTGIFDADRYYLFQNGIWQNDYWSFVTIVYKRWKL